MFIHSLNGISRVYEKDIIAPMKYTLMAYTPHGKLMAVFQSVNRHEK